MSLIKWPTDGWWKHWFLIANVDASESPSKIELCKSSSRIKVTALQAAMVSTATMEDGEGMVSDRAASTSPEEFRTTTPIPTTPNSSKTARSKFVFKVLGSGGFQMASFGGCLMMKMLIFFKMLLCQVWEFIQWHHCLLGSNFVFFFFFFLMWLILFWWFHMNQQVVMKSSAPIY